MNPVKNNSGFTLTEVLIAAVIVVAGIMAYLMVSGNVIGQNAQSKKKTIAVTLAQDRVESIKNTALTVSLDGADGLASPTESAGVWTANATGEVVDATGTAGTADAPRRTASTTGRRNALGSIPRRAARRRSPSPSTCRCRGSAASPRRRRGTPGTGPAPGARDR